MTTIAPTLQEDIFGTKEFTIVLTVRNSTNTADSTTSGVLYTTESGGAVITGENTYEITIVGTQNECNTALQNLVYFPDADVITDAGVSYYQTDDNGNGTPGSNPKNGFMAVNIRDTHTEFAMESSVVYNEDAATTFYLGAITDVRGTTVPSTTYEMTVTVPVASGVVSGWTNAGSGVFKYDGTKQVCNDALTSFTFVPELNYVSTFTITYQQQQTTDNIDQGSTSISATVGALNTEFSIVGSIGYVVDTINYKNLGSILDPANPASTQYKMTLSLGTTNGAISTNGTGWIDEGSGNYTYTGTKTSCNTALSAVQYIPPADSVAQMNMTYSQMKVSGSVQQGTKAIQMNATQSSTNYAVTGLQVYRDYYSNLGISITDIRPDNINPALVYDWQLDTLTADISLNKITTDAGFTRSIPAPSPSGASVSITRDSSLVVMSTLGGGSNVVNVYTINNNTLLPYDDFVRQDPSVATGCYSTISGNGQFIVLSTPANIELWEDSGANTFIWRSTFANPIGQAVRIAVNDDASLLIVGNNVYRMNVTTHVYTLVSTLPYTITTGDVAMFSGTGMFISFPRSNNTVQFLYNSNPGASNTWTSSGSAATVFPMRHSVAKDRGAFLVKGTVYEYNTSGLFVASYSLAPAFSNTNVSESSIISPDGNTKINAKPVTSSNDDLYIVQGSTARSRQPSKIQGTVVAMSDDYVVGINGSTYNTAYFMKYTEFTITETSNTLQINNSTKGTINNYLSDVYIRNITPGTAVQQLQLNQTQVTDSSVQANNLVLNSTIRTS